MRAKSGRNEIFWLLAWALAAGGCAHEGASTNERVERRPAPQIGATLSAPSSEAQLDRPSAAASSEAEVERAPAKEEILVEERKVARPASPPAPALGKRHKAGAEIAYDLGVGGYGRGGGGGVAGPASLAEGRIGSAALSRSVVHKQLAPQRQELNTEAYAHIAEQSFAPVREEPLSTFSIDVDTASYANVRRFLRDGALPPADAVRIEELINYFDYDYPKPQENEPFSIYAEVGDCPWNQAHRLVHIGVQGRKIAQENVPPRNLVFLVDVSGSMLAANKLPLLKQGLSLLARDLRPQDRVSIAVYAGSSGLALPSTSGKEQGKILDALSRLEAGGSTNGAEGIELAYQQAQKHFVKGGINRVILATDGDFNVGVTSEGELVRLIEEKRKSGVFLTVLGFGSGNLQDARMEQLADKGNGNYAYIDSIAEAHKVLVREAGATLVTIAKDVKLQVEWNPAHVASYRLIGYENRILAARDFNDDKKDAGEIGAGHNVTALYEIVPAGSEEAGAPTVDALRYQAKPEETKAALSGELLTVKVRYKAPDGETSKLLTRPLIDAHRALSSTSDSFRFAAAVAGFGMLLRDSKYKGAATLDTLSELARGASKQDAHGDRSEFLDMMKAARRLGLGG